MPLLLATIVTEVRKIADPAQSGHSWPTSAANAKARWGAAVRTYFDALTAPALVPGTTSAAEAALVVAFDTTLGVVGLEQGLAAFAGALVLGLGPGLVASVPPAPPAWGALGLTLDGTARATQIATAIDTWARTGLYGPTGGPPSLPWS